MTRETAPSHPCIISTTWASVWRTLERAFAHQGDYAQRAAIAGGVTAFAPVGLREVGGRMYPAYRATCTVRATRKDGTLTTVEAAVDVLDNRAGVNA